jgi:hypothetical protein
MIDLANLALDKSFKMDTISKSRDNSQFSNLIQVRNYEAIKKTSESISEELIWNQLSELYNDYQKINEKQYFYSFSTIIDANNDLLNLNFYKTKEASMNETKRILVKSDNFRFKVKDIRIVNSAGLIFAKFNIAPENYSLTNGKIVGTKGDQITPIISSFLNVFSNSDAPVKIGGNLGIGISVNESKSIHFMLGPSISIGRSNLLNIHAGIFTSRTNRLSQGLNVGDNIAGSVVPLIYRYELGKYLGISFNLSSLSIKK